MGKLTEEPRGYQPLASRLRRPEEALRGITKERSFFLPNYGSSVAMHVDTAQLLSSFKRVLRRAIREGSASLWMLLSS